MQRSLALATCLALVTAACAGRTWPTAAVAAIDPGLTARAALTVDVLPADIVVWAEPGVTASPDEVRSSIETRVVNATLDAIVQRAYGIQAVIDRTGRAGTLEILAPGALHATMGTLASYGDSTLGAPHLPAPLGEVTGADATLYVGGWAYLAPRRESTAEKVAEGVALALAVVAVVAIVAVIASGLSDSKSKSKSKSDKSRRGGASFREDREEAIANVRDHRGRGNVRDHRGRGNVRDHLNAARGGTGIAIRDHRSGGSAPQVRDHRDRDLVRDGGAWHYPRYTRTQAGIDIALDALDALDAVPEPEPPPSGESRLFLQMTLVDNRTGGVLWHAHQTFPANPAKPGDATRAAKILLASLPAR